MSAAEGTSARVWSGTPPAAAVNPLDEGKRHQAGVWCRCCSSSSWSECHQGSVPLGTLRGHVLTADTAVTMPSVGPQPTHAPTVWPPAPALAAVPPTSWISHQQRLASPCPGMSREGAGWHSWGHRGSWGRGSSSAATGGPTALLPHAGGPWSCVPHAEPSSQDTTAVLQCQSCCQRAGNLLGCREPGRWRMLPQVGRQ